MHTGCDWWGFIFHSVDLRVVSVWLHFFSLQPFSWYKFMTIWNFTVPFICKIKLQSAVKLNNASLNKHYDNGTSVSFDHHTKSFTICYAGIVKLYLHRWGLLSEGGCLACILLPWHLELLCRRCSSSKGFWDGGLVRLLLPLCFLLLKVTVQSKERQKKPGSLWILFRACESCHSADYPINTMWSGEEKNTTKENLNWRTWQTMSLLPLFAHNSK